MAITEPTQARVLRGVSSDHRGHPFVSISDLPRLDAVRPRATGNDALDAIRAAAWDEGFANGRQQGFEAGHAEGIEVGVAEGRTAGYAAGRGSAVADAVAQVRGEVESALVALDAAAAELAGTEAVALADIESTVVDLALSIAQAVLQRELSVVSDPGAEALGRALALAPDHGDLVAHLNPADLDSLGDLADLAPGRSIRLVSDPGVGRGGALVEAGAARLDARLETALERVREVLDR
jgi:flagellar assembly protein FliH